MTLKKLKNDLYGNNNKQPLLLRKSFIKVKNISNYMPNYIVINNLEQFFGKNIVSNFDLNLVINNPDNLLNLHLLDMRDFNLVIIYKAEKQSLKSIKFIIDHYDKAKIIIITTNTHFNTKLKDSYNLIYQFEIKE